MTKEELIKKIQDQGDPKGDAQIFFADDGSGGHAYYDIKEVTYLVGQEPTNAIIEVGAFRCGGG